MRKIEFSTKMDDAVEAFMLSRRVMNCSARTLALYTAILARFVRGVGVAAIADVGSLAVQAYLTGLRATMSAVTAHQHFRVLRTLFNWCVETGALAESPMRGIEMRCPKTLPRVPEDDAVRRLMAACGDSFEGKRNRALVALLADSGLRASEALRLRIEDIRFGERTLTVKAGKGGKDGTGFFGAECAHLLRSWLAVRGDAQPEDFIFTSRTGRSLTRTHALHIMHNLSVRAKLPRKVGCHQLRSYAATSILKASGDLELVRQVLRHETLAMSLKYAAIAQPEIARKFRRASPVDSLRAGR